MKKLFLSFAFLCLVSFATPAKASSYPNCGTWIIWCNGVPSYYAVACTLAEVHMWQSLLCEDS